MGFWSQVLGVDNHAAAYNAVLMEHALGVLSQRDADEVMAAFKTVVASGAPGGRWTPTLSAMVRTSGRLVQLNLLALTMAHTDRPPTIAGELWWPIRNPFASAADTVENWAKVRAVEADMLRRHRVHITVPRESLF